MYKAVFCIAPTIDQTETIVNNLKTAGFSNNDISVLFPDTHVTHDFAYEKLTKSPERAAFGGTVGLGTDARLGWLAGIGSLAIPGIGPFIAAGPIMGSLGGAAADAATGCLTVALMRVGIPEYEVKRYEGKIKAGNSLISVNTASIEDRDSAKKIFGQAHAEDILSTEESSSVDT